MSGTALFIVDVQNDWMQPDGAMPVPNGNEVIPIIEDLLDPAIWRWDLVIATQVGTDSLICLSTR